MAAGLPLRGCQEAAWRRSLEGRCALRCRERLRCGVPCGHVAGGQWSKKRATLPTSPRGTLPRGFIHTATLPPGSIAARNVAAGRLAAPPKAARALAFGRFHGRNGIPPLPVRLKPTLSIVIPAYNEAGRLPRNLPAVAACCDALDLRTPDSDGYEVLVMVERSTDGTLEKARAAAAPHGRVEVVDNGPQRGKGHAVREGMLRAEGAVVLFMDADLSTPLEEVGKFLDHLAAHPADDVLIGNRRHAAARVGREQGWLRRNLGRLFNRLVRRAGLLPGGWADTQCGFKAFRHAAAREVFSRQTLDGFSFDVEALALAAALGLRVVDLPVAWYDEAATRVRLWRDGAGMLRDLWRVRPLVARSLREHPPGRQPSVARR